MRHIKRMHCINYSAFSPIIFLIFPRRPKSSAVWSGQLTDLLKFYIRLLLHNPKLTDAVI